MKRLFAYDGFVKEYHSCNPERWASQTMAVSSKQALNQLAYQYKVYKGLCRDARVVMNPSCLKEIN